MLALVIILALGWTYFAPAKAHRSDESETGFGWIDNLEQQRAAYSRPQKREQLELIKGGEAAETEPAWDDIDIRGLVGL